jgi:hypothetical protein
VLSLLIIPRTFQQLKSAAVVLKTTTRELLHGPAVLPASLVSGVYLPADSGKELIQKASVIKSLSKSGPVYYLTGSSFIIPCLSGVYSAAPVNDLFSGLALESDTDHLVDLLRQRDARTILVDAPNAVLGNVIFWRDCFIDLRQRLSRYYRCTSTSDGWEVWTKEPDNAKPKA